MFQWELCSKKLIECANYSFGDQVCRWMRASAGISTVDFHLYDTDKKLGHIQVVNDQTADMLIPNIQQYMKPGCTIFSNKRSVFRWLANLGYHHLTGWQWTIPKSSKTLWNPPLALAPMHLRLIWAGWNATSSCIGCRAEISSVCASMSFFGKTGSARRNVTMSSKWFTWWQIIKSLVNLDIAEND